MLDLGTVRPGSTIRIPFTSFDKDDGSAISMSGYAASDILVFRDGNTTARASTAGFTATTDFSSKTGKHLAVIDLADNTTSAFWTAGSEYLVAIDAVTIDTVSTGAWIARFRIGYPGAMFDTTIASLASQTSFTLTTGPAEDDALNGCTVLIHDIASAVQCGLAIVLDYTGSTKTVTLHAGTTFTAASGDNISVMFPAPAAASVATAVRAELGTELARLDVPLSDLPTATENADALLNRDMAAVSDTNTRSPLNGLRFLRNGFSISGTTLTVLREDDTTPAYTRDLTTDAAAEPITGVS